MLHACTVSIYKWKNKKGYLELNYKKRKTNRTVKKSIQIVTANLEIGTGGTDTTYVLRIQKKVKKY